MTSATTPPAADSYDEVPYPSAPYRGTHPSSIAALAHIFGMQAPDPTNCRVLELGCASGGNLLPMAQDLPGSHFVGIDLSARQVAAGQEQVTQLGLKNLELRHQSILDFAAGPGSFDYVLCHGVFSWVPRIVQDQILSIAARCLSPAGVIYVSYNTYPGWYLRGIVRDMLRYHAASFPDPQARISQSRELLKFLVKTAHGRTAAYTQVLRDEAEIIDGTSDAYLYHEHLEDVNQPFYFHEFVDRLSAAGLQYLAETDLPGMLSENLAPEISAMFEKTPMLRQEQYMDFLTNRMFRCTLACRAGVQLRLWLHLDDAVAWIEEPVAPRDQNAVDVGCLRHGSLLKVTRSQIGRRSQSRHAGAVRPARLRPAPGGFARQCPRCPASAGTPGPGGTHRGAAAWSGGGGCG